MSEQQKRAIPQLPTRVIHAGPIGTLSPEAAERIQHAYAQAHLIRTKAEVSVDLRHRLENRNIPFPRYAATGQPAIELAEANLRATRYVLTIVAKEFIANGTAGHDLWSIMLDQIEAARNSLELTEM